MMKNSIDNKNVYYVYTYTDPRNDEIFYVGKGKKYRDTEHLRAVKNKWVHRVENQQKYDRILAILNNNQEPIITRVASSMSEADAFTLEASLINKYKRVGEDGSLVNIYSGSQQDAYSRKCISESLKKYYANNSNPMLGRKTSDETKVKQSLSRAVFFANGGVIHNKKIWVTPYGEFFGRLEAAIASGVTEKQINKRCASQCDMSITRQSAIQIKDFDALLFIGKTWRELGWFQKTI